MSSNAARYWPNDKLPAFLMFGTIRDDVPSFAFHVDSQSEIDLLAHDAKGLAVLLGVGVVDLPEIAERAKNRPANDMRVGNLALPDNRAVLIDQAADSHRAPAPALPAAMSLSGMLRLVAMFSAILPATPAKWHQFFVRADRNGWRGDFHRSRSRRAVLRSAV